MGMLPSVESGECTVAEIRSLFPILGETARGKRLAYLDNAATTQKPETVIRALDQHYRRDNANVHRAVHELAERATSAYEQARRTIADFVGSQPDEIVFTRGTTEGINLVARSFLQPQLKPGDEVLLTQMEHHSNIVPWQLAGATTIAAPVRDDGSVDLPRWRSLFSERTRLVAIAHVSNTLGTVNPVREMIAEAHDRGIPVLIDGAQAVAHMPVDVRRLDADFYAFSAHKLYGPTGFGVLYGKRAHLEAMPPWQGGGDMIETVTFEGCTWNEVPYKFEAGTPDVAGAVGLAAAIKWLQAVGFPMIVRNEHSLLQRATDALSTIDGLRIIGQAENKAGILSFVMDDIHPQDIGSVLDMEGVAVRTGHHCTMPLMRRFNVPATVRASLAVYNDETDIDQFIHAIDTVKRLFQ